MKKTILSDALQGFDPLEQAREQTDFDRLSGEARRGDIMIRLPYDVRHRLRQLALDRGTTMQRLVEEGIDHILVQHGHSPMLAAARRGKEL